MPRFSNATCRIVIGYKELDIPYGTLKINPTSCNAKRPCIVF